MLNSVWCSISSNNYLNNQLCVCSFYQCWIYVRLVYFRFRFTIDEHFSQCHWPLLKAHAKVALPSERDDILWGAGPVATMQASSAWMKQAAGVLLEEVFLHCCWLGLHAHPSIFSYRRNTSNITFISPSIIPLFPTHFQSCSNQRLMMLPRAIIMLITLLLMPCCYCII